MTSGDGRLRTHLECTRTRSPGRPGRPAVGMALPAPLGAATIGRLQRTAGNQAVLRLLGAAGQRGLHRVMDLRTQFASKTLDDGQKALLARFQAVVNTLANESLVNRHLIALGARIRAGQISLSDALAEGERGVWAVPRPILIDFAERPTFIGVATSGQAFEDLVGPLLHGVHTHRIQWYVVRQELGAAEAVALYRASLDPRWNNSLGTMWDLIVDATGAKDYTRPEVLLEHLMGLRKGANKDLKALGKAVGEAERSGEKLRKDLRDLYPEEKALTAAVRDAAREYRAIMGKPDQELGAKARFDAAEKVIDRVRFERVTTVEKHARLTGGAARPVIWTGWADVGRSKYADELKRRHTLVPTVAYVDVDPDAGPATSSDGTSAQGADGKTELE